MLVVVRGYIYIYRSVPLIRPPILYTTSSLKWVEGLYSNMQLVSNISPPPPPPPPPKKKKKFYAIATYTSKVHVYIRTQLQKHKTVLFVDITFTKLRGLPTSEKSCQFNARSITFTVADFAVAVLKNSNTVGHVPREISSLLVLPAQEWQRDDLYLQC